MNQPLQIIVTIPSTKESVISIKRGRSEINLSEKELCVITDFFLSLPDDQYVPAEPVVETEEETETSVAAV